MNNLREWGNGIAVAGLIVAVGVAMAQAPQGNTWYMIAIGVTVISAIAAIVLLRPKAEEKNARHLSYLRQQTSERDLAVLHIGEHITSFPETLSQQSLALAPAGETWQEESKETAKIRTDRLIIHGLMERRGEREVETSDLGRALLAFDVAFRVKRHSDPTSK